MKKTTGVAFAMFLVGCLRPPTQYPPDEPPPDAMSDLAWVFNSLDMDMGSSSSPDLAQPADLGSVPDLVSPPTPDLSLKPDLGITPDQIAPADLTTAVSDLKPASDLTQSPDFVVWSDMSSPPDLATLPDLLALADLKPADDMSSQCGQNNPCPLGQYCAGGSCYSYTDQHGRTPLGASGANGGPLADGTPDNWDDDGDGYCEVAPCVGTANPSLMVSDLKGGDCDDDPKDGAPQTIPTPKGSFQTDGSWGNNPAAMEWNDGFDNNCDGIVK